MEPSAVLRRIVHLSTPVFLLYYFLPSPLWGGGPQKEVGLLLALVATLAFFVLLEAKHFVAKRRSCGRPVPAEAEA